jgi:Ca2+-dependent lipid-binding protein
VTSNQHKPSAAQGRYGRAFLGLTIHIQQRQGLAACDYNVIGKATSSDAYVIASIVLEDKKDPIVIGKTKHILSTLNPKWNATLSSVFPPGTHEVFILRLKIMDHDLIGEDDCMGIVDIPMKVGTFLQPSAWYELPISSARLASGRLLVGIESKMHYAMDFFLQSPQRPRTSTKTSQ